MNATSERRLHVTCYAIILIMGILALSTFAPPLLLALLAVPTLVRRRRAAFVPQQPMPAALQEVARWSRWR